MKKIFVVISMILILSMMPFALFSCDDTDSTEPEKSDESSGESSTENSTGENTDKILTEEEMKKLDVTEYDLDKYLSPIWSGNISYAEASFVRENDAGLVEPLRLLYPIEQIISVRSFDLTIEYKEGVDYRVNEDGELEILEGGSIPVLAYEDYYFDNDPSKPSIYAANVAGKSFYWNDINRGLTMGQWTLSITYKHAADDWLTAPEYKGDYFANLIEKLEAKKRIKVVSLGDSITKGWSATGSNADGKSAIAPYTPAYNEIVIDYMKDKYGVKVGHENLAQSAKGVALMSSEEKLSAMCAADPDLVIISVGVNDTWMTPEEFSDGINKILNRLKEDCPDACAIVVGACFPNKDASFSDGGGAFTNYTENSKLSQFAKKLSEDEFWTWENGNAAFADLTSLNLQMFDRKVYQDLSGSNSNHPNDYMHRIYAQTVIQTIFGLN